MLLKESYPACTCDERFQDRGGLSPNDVPIWVLRIIMLIIMFGMIVKELYQVRYFSNSPPGPFARGLRQDGDQIQNGGGRNWSWWGLAKILSIFFILEQCFHLHTYKIKRVRQEMSGFYLTNKLHFSVCVCTLIDHR